MIHIKNYIEILLKICLFSLFFFIFMLNTINYFSVYVDKTRSCVAGLHETINTFVWSYVRGGNTTALLLSPHPVVYLVA